MSALTRRALVVIATGAGLLLAVGCKSPPNRPDPEIAAAPTGPVPVGSHAPRAAESPLPAFTPGSTERGKQLVAEFECHRCHQGTGLAAPQLDQDCVRCHEQIATGKFKASPAKLAKWKPHVMPYRDVPSLSAMGGRLRPAWVMDYLLHPHDLRPNLAPTMPRLKLSAEQARDIATYLTSAGGDSPPMAEVNRDGASIGRGKRLMLQRGCTGCHEMGGAGFSAPAKTDPVARTLGLAPDLRFVRWRAEPSAVLRWLLDPTKVKHDSAMPSLQLGLQDAHDLAAFVSFGELEPPPAPPPVARLPVLGRKVGFEEVNERVFAVTCRHCHTNPDSANGDGGPGNTGGFGFKSRKIDFSSYEGIQSGGIDASGQRVSLFTKTSEGLPLLVAALIARVREDHRVVSDEVRGMPLGLPPLSAEQIQLVESWVEQGRPL
ncbi:MAG TPA: c-type cytochrome [Polyangiaceae bacterium]|nr:c-type cytochrome [Polyangiaceae bacterium]